VLGPEHPSVAQALFLMAMTYHSQGRDLEAEPLSVRSLEISEMNRPGFVGGSNS
jgi:hypothetical protein